MALSTSTFQAPRSKALPTALEDSSESSSANRRTPGPSRLSTSVPPTAARTTSFVRNHTVQYSSEPEWPGVYESYADMQAGEWTHMRMVVKGRDAALYINHADQPCLIMHDLKLGESEGSVARSGRDPTPMATSATSQSPTEH